MNRQRGAKADAPGASGVQRATGRDRPEWFDLLDAWGAAGRPYREIADWLTGEHGLSAWWAQKLIVEYEEARGLRPPGARRDGTFEVGASKTVGVGPDEVVAAFVDATARERWLPGAVLLQRGAVANDVVRFAWDGGPSRLVVRVERAGEARSQVTLLHQRIATAAAAQELKAFWRERLVALKQVLERGPRG